LIPRTFRNGEHLDESKVPAYSAYSQSNAISTELNPGRLPENQHQVIFVNYGRLQDYEELISKSGGKITRLTLEATKYVVIARYDRKLIAII
jgi:hypothetical protein